MIKKAEQWVGRGGLESVELKWLIFRSAPVNPDVRPVAEWKMRDLLEYDHDNEIYTDTASEELIERNLDFFDGEDTFYCALADGMDESTLRCFGEPDRRILEVSLREEKYVDARLVNRSAKGMTKLRVEKGDEATALVDVPVDEIFTKQQALEVFLFFYRTGKIPDTYSRRQKTRIGM